MRNKGFTLIELLAVIVILAIIALIATPVILGIINDSRNQARVRSAELVVSTVQRDYATAYMKNNGQEPTLAGLAAAVRGDLTNANVTSDSTSMTVVTSDGVTCKFVLEAGKLKLENGKCKDNNNNDVASEAMSVEIGTLSA